MNHSLDKIRTPKGEVRFELRVWGRRTGAIRRRFKLKEEALKLVEELYQESRSTESSHESEKNDPRFQDEYAYWYVMKGQTFAPGWHRTQLGFWRDLKDRLGDKQISSITKAYFASLEQELRARGNKQKTINEKLGFIVSVLNHSVDHDRIESHQLSKWKKGRVNREHVEFWSPLESAEFLSSMKARHYGTSTQWVYVVYLLALNTGMRASEIWGLDFSAIKWEEGLIHVRVQYDLHLRRLRETKGKEERYAPMNLELSQELKRLSRGRTKGFVFENWGKPIRHRAFIQRFQRDLKFSGCKRISFHKLRHSAGTAWIAKGVDIKTVQTMLGHKDIQTTMRYVHATAEGVRHVAATISLSPSVTPVSD